MKKIREVLGIILKGRLSLIKRRRNMVKQAHQYQYEEVVGKGFFGQHGQDQFLVEEIFQHKKEGFFVDIGANDGVSFSNSYFLEKELKWSGLLVEPHPAVFEKCEHNRTNTCVHRGVSHRSGNLPFTMIEGDVGQTMLSGFQEHFSRGSETRVNQNIEQKNAKAKTVEIQCSSINEFLDEFKISKIDLLCMDTEGGEFETLKSLDFSKFQVDVICVENNGYHYKLCDFLYDKGYQIVAVLGADEIYQKIK